MRRRPFGAACTAGILVAVFTLAGCDLLGGSDAPPPAAPGTGVERPAPRMSIMPTIDLAPFHLAVRNGYFQAEGVTVQTTTAASGPASVARTVAGEFAKVDRDIAAATGLLTFRSELDAASIQRVRT